MEIMGVIKILGSDMKLEIADNSKLEVHNSGCCLCYLEAIVH